MGRCAVDDENFAGRFGDIEGLPYNPWQLVNGLSSAVVASTDAASVAGFAGHGLRTTKES